MGETQMKEMNAERTCMDKARAERHHTEKISDLVYVFQ